jgi:hypothetical protein
MFNVDEDKIKDCSHKIMKKNETFDEKVFSSFKYNLSILIKKYITKIKKLLLFSFQE